MSEIIYAEINPMLMKWARESRGFTIEDAAKKIKISEEKLIQVEKGSDQITMNQLRTASEVYKRPITIFYLNNIPNELSIPDLRRISIDNAVELSPDARLVLRKIREKRMNAVDLYSLLSITYSYSFIGLFDQDTPIEIAGERIRTLLNLSTDQIPAFSDEYNILKFWKDKLEALGLLVFQFQGISTEEIRGFVLSELPYPTIAINQKDAIFARVFTLIHELVHIILNITGICDPFFSRKLDTNKLETFCNYVAGATLVPMTELFAQPIVNTINESNLFSTLNPLSKHFKVSRDVILRRLLIGKKISKMVYDETTKKIPKSTKEPKSGMGNYYNNYFSSNSKEYIKIIFKGLNSDNLSIHKALSYLDVKYETFEKIQGKIETEGLD